MKARHILIGAISCFSVGGFALAGGRPQPSAPPLQNPSAPAPAPRSNTGSSSTGTGSNSTGTGSSSTGTGSDSNRSGYPYGYGYPYGNPYGYPTAGVYYPYGNNPNNNPNGSSSNPNSSTSSTAAQGNSNPFAGTPDSTPAAPAPSPRTPAVSSTPAVAPDPELAAATAEYNAAVDHLKESLKDNPDYKTALDEKKAARAEAAALRDKSDVKAVDTLAVAQRGLDASKRLSEIEKTAMAKDERVVAARARLDAALAAHNGTVAAAPK